MDWKISKSGNSYVMIDGLPCTIFYRRGKYSFVHNDVFSKVGYDTEERAKIAVETIMPAQNVQVKQTDSQKAYAEFKARADTRHWSNGHYPLEKKQ